MDPGLPKWKPDQGSPSCAIYISERMVWSSLGETDPVSISSFEKEKKLYHQKYIKERAYNMSCSYTDKQKNLSWCYTSPHRFGGFHLLPSLPCFHFSAPVGIVMNVKMWYPNLNVIHNILLVVKFFL